MTRQKIKTVCVNLSHQADVDTFDRSLRHASFPQASYNQQLTKLPREKISKMTTRFKLNTGAEIPAIGFGTWQDKESQEAAVAEAIKAGYRHIDTARV